MSCDQTLRDSGTKEGLMELERGQPCSKFDKGEKGGEPRIDGFPLLAHTAS